MHNDTITVYSAQPIHYFIEECLSYSLRYRTSVGETVSLHKAESDTLSFGTVVPVKVVENEVFEKDSVISMEESDTEVMRTSTRPRSG